MLTAQLSGWTQLLGRPTVFFDGSVMPHGRGWLDHESLSFASTQLSFRKIELS